MGTLWPDPPALPARCQRCHHPVARSRLVAGRYGSGCAEQLGLTTTTPRVRTDPQTGTDLLDLIEGNPNVQLLPPDRINDNREFINEPDDCCDGWDR